MKILSLNYIATVLFMLTIFSCNDIIETSPESIITVNSFWQTEEDALGGLYGMYNQFRNFTTSQLFPLGEARSEVIGQGLISATSIIKYIDNDLSESNADLSWQQMYRIVNYANLVIKYVPGIEFVDENDKNNTIAQAYSMRAYIYFVMAKTWGDVPMVTEPTEGFDAETIFVERSPADDIFQFIKSDIEKARNLFVDNEFNTKRSIWSLPALNMLKGDVFLWTGKTLGGGQSDISTALAALEEVENADVELLDDFASIFEYSNKGNKEVILAVNYTDLEASNNYFQNMYILPIDVTPSIDEATRNIIGVAGGNNPWAPTALIRNQFDQNDQRRDASFVEIYRQDGGQSSYYTSVVLKGNGFVDAGIRKFLDDIIIYRYADLLLMKAEAKNALGQDPSAEMNQVRQRAYGDQFPNYSFVSGSQVENDSAILQERLFELAFESKRWWDLVRFGKAFELVPSLVGKENVENILLWPVPLRTISLNSRIEQTKGY